MKIFKSSCHLPIVKSSENFLIPEKIIFLWFKTIKIKSIYRIQIFKNTLLCFVFLFLHNKIHHSTVRFEHSEWWVTRLASIPDNLISFYKPNMSGLIGMLCKWLQFYAGLVVSIKIGCPRFLILIILTRSLSTI